MIAKKLNRNVARMACLCKGKRCHKRIVLNRLQEGTKLNRTKYEEHSHDPKREAEITNAVCNKGFNRRIIRGFVLEPEANQQI